jgi:predicted nuclease of predicted toxin-antitoxin system
LKILLDENFPLPLYHRLQSAGYDVEHIIVLGQRGIKDSDLLKRLAREELIFLTHDTEFADFASRSIAKIIISRIRQYLPIRQRVEIWFNAITQFMNDLPNEKLFDLLETGEAVPLKIGEGR